MSTVPSPDDSEYLLAYGTSLEVTAFPVDLPPGEHVLNASLRNADLWVPRTWLCP